MAATPASVRLEREKRKSEREREVRQLLRDTVLTPNMIRLAMVAGIIAYATSEARSPENVGPVRTALAYALPSIGIPMIAADAGIHDKWALGAISAASVGYVTGQMLWGWGEAGLIPSAGTVWGWAEDFFMGSRDLDTGYLEWKNRQQ